MTEVSVSELLAVIGEQQIRIRWLESELETARKMLELTQIDPDVSEEKND